MNDLYEGKFLADGYPEIEKIGVEYFRKHQVDASRIDEVFECIERLIDLREGLKTVCVIGCGPNPGTVRHLLDSNYEVIGIEPVPESANAARECLGDPTRIINCSAEVLPLANNSQRVMLFESVLEHVDSPDKTLSEAYRVLSPGGVVYIYTTNRYHVSLTGTNDEFNVRFYNWFPALVKESYVFKHLHYDPRLANYTPRPAVHWFTYSELCKLGRSVGFSQFYSFIDLANAESPSVKNKLMRKWLLQKVRYNPWLRALALLQFGSSIFMFKRETAGQP